MLHYGLYEQVINNKLDAELSAIAENRKFIKSIDEAEASKVLSQYLSKVIERGLDNVKDLPSKIKLANQIITLIQKNTNEPEFALLNVVQRAKRAEQLLVLLREFDPILASNKSAKDMKRPETSIARSSLFTGATNEPQMGTELKKEIASADRIDMLVSFIKWSGLRQIKDDLEDFTKNGGQLRVITTTYMGVTDVKAIEELWKLPNTVVKVSYDTKRTRLHAKTYVFYRDTGFTTAYVGSSNLSNAAISSGLEWNIKVTRNDLPETINKIEATFESYWNSDEFEKSSEDKKERLLRALNEERKPSDRNNSEIYIMDMDMRPYSYQEEILERLEAERTFHKSERSLVVAATGTGKTVISAFDYKRFKEKHPKEKCRLLFVAHREEILKQSRYTFRAVLKDPNFGELFVGNYKPESAETLFISIQTFNSQDFTSKTAQNFYDYIIIDEFHHAAAPTYQKLLEYYKPKFLLGLTATPERMDGKSILSYFKNRIAVEIRLPEAIDRKLLCPFQYFGVTDNVDLNDLKWSKGGYDKGELSKIYTYSGMVSNHRAELVVNSIFKYVTDIKDVKGLGFCVSVEHAEFMCHYFNKHNIPSMCLTGKSLKEERNNAKNKLVSGQVRFIFVVDIYNEGVDIPEVNTVLFLRPTESLTIFLQQLGRGLRLSKDKECLTVLDFIGQANKRYNFEEKFAALLSNACRSVTGEIKKGFISVPKGCYIQLEKKAEEYILNNIRESYRGSGSILSRIATFKEDTGEELTLENFLDYYHIDPRIIYKLDSFSRMCVKARVIEDFSEDVEENIKKAMINFACVNSPRWINFLRDILSRIDYVDFSALSPIEKRMMHMFYESVWGNTVSDWNNEDVLKNLRSLSKSPVMKNELLEFLRYRFDQIDYFTDKSVDVGFDCPLELHCTYTRNQILVAMDFMKPNTVREGVKWLPDKKLDVLLVTLNKSDKDYSPTTMYNDYSINDTLFHWQSQSTTSDTSPTGQRYINHRKNGSKILLFVREFKRKQITGKEFTEAYTYLGTATYVKHEGSLPMNIIWKLDNPIPARFLKKTNKLVIG